jgi:hypothetical protein
LGPGFFHITVYRAVLRDGYFLAIGLSGELSLTSLFLVNRTTILSVKKQNQKGVVKL